MVCWERKKTYPHSFIRVFNDSNKLSKQHIYFNAIFRLLQPFNILSNIGITFPIISFINVLF